MKLFTNVTNGNTGAYIRETMRSCYKNFGNSLNWKNTMVIPMPSPQTTTSRAMLGYKAPYATRHRSHWQLSNLPTSTSEQLDVSQQSSGESTPNLLPVQTHHCEHWPSATACPHKRSPFLAWCNWTHLNITFIAQHTWLWTRDYVCYSAADTAAATASPFGTAAARSVFSSDSSSRMH